MSHEFIFDPEPNSHGGGGGGGGEGNNNGLTENISLETPSSSAVPFPIIGIGVGAIGEPSNNIGLPYQSEVGGGGGGGVNGVGAGGAGGGSMIQSSPPHYRHSRAYRHFKNPPQPHMCIRTTTEHGEELFINVLSWTRIVIPQEASDPIPLYGGMRVPPGSPRSPPVVFAVMANPEVLKDSGRHSKDPEERRAMVELMCDFVEAMNPGVKLIRNAVILKDRDISGELKDVWNAVQAQRDREREEQMIQQRQQQHYHSTTTQQLFPKIQNSSFDESQQIELQLSCPSNGPDNNIIDAPELGQDSAVIIKNDNSSEVLPKASPNDAITKTSETVDSAISSVTIDPTKDHQLQCEPNESIIMSLEPALIQVNNIHNSKLSSISNTDDLTTTTQATPKPTSLTNGNGNGSVNKKTPSPPAAEVSIPSSTATATNTTTATNKAPPVVAAAAPPKKEKLGGFLPNGCIFPRFKNNKHKDKDKDNSKSTSKDREKTLLHVLKKNKDKQQQQDDPAKTQYEKNCLNLESEVEKLDLNKLDNAANNDNNMFMKLKVATSAAK